MSGAILVTTRRDTVEIWEMRGMRRSGFRIRCDRTGGSTRAAVRARDPRRRRPGAGGRARPPGPGVGLDARAGALAAACPSPGRTARPSRSRTPSSLSPRPPRTGCRVAAGGVAALDPADRRCRHNAPPSSSSPARRLTPLRLVPRLVLRRLFPLALLALFAFPLLLVLATALLLRVVFLAT